MNLDPGAAVQDVASKLKDLGDECGLDKVDEFIDKLENIKESAKQGPGDVMDKVKDSFKSFKETLDNAANDPASLAPSGGGLAVCASWYGRAVAAKLKSLAEEIATLFDALVKVVGQIAQPFKELGETMGEAMRGLNSTVKGLTNMPKQILQIADSVKSPGDVAKIDVEPMKKSLDTSGMTSPLDKIAGLKDLVGPVIKEVKDIIDQLLEFIDGAPDKLKNAFAVPSPLCCCSKCLLSQAPPMLKNLLEKLESLKGIDMTKITGTMSNMSDTVGNLNMDVVKVPINEFAEKAKDPIDTLDKAVGAAKLASGALPGEMPKLW